MVLQMPGREPYLQKLRYQEPRWRLRQLGKMLEQKGKKQLTVRVQVVDVKGLKQLARLYVWVIRGTPLLVKLYVIFMGFRDWG